MADDPDINALVEGLIEEGSGPITKAGLAGELPQDVLDACQDCTGALRDLIAAGRQLEADRAELTRRRDLLPADGYERLWREAHADAKAKADQGQRDAERAYKRLEASLQDATLPAIPAGREALARDEAALALSVGNPEAEPLDLAGFGNAEAVAALLSPWGKTLLRARGVRNPDKLLAEVRKLTVARAIGRGDTAAARALRDSLGALGAAKGSAGSTVRDLTRPK